MAEKEYIEREAAYPLAKKICDAIDSEDFQRLNFGMRILDWIDDIPAADVRPVVRGKWEVSRTDYGWNGAEFPTHCKCTECGREVPYQDKDNFCPNCGADMRNADD